MAEMKTLNGYEVVDEKARADIALKVPTKTSQLENDSGFLTEHQDLSEYAKKASTLAGYGITDGVTKEEVSRLSSEIADLGNTKAEKNDLNGKLSINQGSANVGKILVVGTDGNLTLVDMPEGGTSGDVTGVLDESNNVLLLSGNLADGTYTLKWLNEDGIYSDAGTMEVGAIPEPEEIINQIPISIDSSGNVYNGTGYKSGVRIRSDGITESTDLGGRACVLTGYIPIGCGDTFRTKNVTFGDDTTGYISFVWLYDSSFNKLASCGFKTDANSGTFKPTLEDGIYTFTIPSDVSGVSYMRVQAQTLDNTSIITVNQEIV